MIIKNHGSQGEISSSLSSGSLLGRVLPSGAKLVVVESCTNGYLSYGGYVSDAAIKDSIISSSKTS